MKPDAKPPIGPFLLVFFALVLVAAIQMLLVPGH